jgi:hypothetical protein
VKLPTTRLASALAQGWCDFWFRPADPTTLGLIRVCTGLVLLYILVASGPLLGPLYGPDAWIDLQTADSFRKEMPWLPLPTGWDENPDLSMLRPEVRDRPGMYQVWKHWGIDPAYTVDLGQPLFSHFFHLSTPRHLAVAHALAIAVAVLFLLGVGTRVSSVLAWVVALCYIHRAPASLFGMDTMLAILLLYLMIGPAGATLSVDRLVSDWRRRRRGMSPADPPASVSANVAIRLLQVHFCIIYFASGTAKLQGAAWWNGTAIWQTLSNYEFAPARFEAFTALLRALTHNRWLWELFHEGGAALTLALEVGLPFLIWYPRWRGLMIAGALGLHTTIALTMGLTAFSLLMMVIVLSFVPAQAVKGWLAKGRALVARRLGGAAPIISGEADRAQGVNPCPTRQPSAR